MPISYRQATLSGANLMIFSGRISGSEILSKFGAIDPDAAGASQNWLIVDIGNADISDLDFDVLSKLRAILEPKMTVMKARRDFEVAIVCDRPLNSPIYQTWKTFVGDDESYPSRPLLFSSLQLACEHLGYLGAERDQLFDLSRGRAA